MALPSTPDSPATAPLSTKKGRGKQLLGRKSPADLWQKWPESKLWPGALSIEEAAAYLRVSPDFIRDLTELDRDGRAFLRHQRFNGKGGRVTKRIRKDDLDKLGLVESRR